MRLGEARMRQLAKQMAREMIARKAVAAPAGADDVAEVILRTIARDQRVVQDIEEEARAIMSRNPNLPPIGTGEYQAIFLQTRRAVAMRKGLRD